MRLVRTAITALAPLALITATAAQTTWIVDASGGAGAQFTSLPQAIAAAAAGDTLIVHAGNYEPFFTSKGLRIVGDPGATVVPTNVASVTIHSLPAGQQFSMRGFDIGCPGFCPVTHVNVLDNRGSVHFEDVRFNNATERGIFVARSDLVTLTRCSGNARGCLLVQQSTAAVVDCQFDSEIGVYVIGSPPAIEIVGSVVDIAGGSYRGGDGQPFGVFEIAQAPGIRVADSQVSVAGAATAIRAGVWTGPTPRPTPALIDSGTSSAVRIDPTVQLVPSAGGTAASGNVVIETVPALTGGATAGAVSLRLDAPSAAPYGLLASLPAAPVSLSFGNLWLDPLTAVPFATGVVGTTGRVDVSLPVTVSLRGAALVFQGATLAGTMLRLTTPATVVVP